MDNKAYMKAMYGCNALHIPAWFVVQDQGPGTVAIVGASRDTSVRYKSEKTHQLIIGELIVRPHLVVESDHLAGAGLSGLLTTGDTIEDWVRHGKVIIDPMGKIIPGGKNLE